MRLFLLVSVAAIAAFALAACGGSSPSSNASSPSAAVKSYLTSLANGDGAGACAVLAPSLQNRELVIARSQGIKASSCADLFSQVKAHMTDSQRKQALNAKVASVTQSGNSARVVVTGARSPFTLEKNGAKWQISAGLGA